MPKPDANWKIAADFYFGFIKFVFVAPFMRVANDFALNSV